MLDAVKSWRRAGRRKYAVRARGIEGAPYARVLASDFGVVLRTDYGEGEIGGDAAGGARAVHGAGVEGGGAVNH
jgi:hypothetical protein